MAEKSFTKFVSLDGTLSTSQFLLYQSRQNLKCVIYSFLFLTVTSRKETYSHCGSSTPLTDARSGEKVDKSWDIISLYIGSQRHGAVNNNR